MRAPRERPGWLQAAAVLAAALASLATPAPRHARNYPAWEIEGSSDRLEAGAALRLWVAKSGKEGFGVTLRVRNLTAAPLRVAVRAARFAIAGAVVAVESDAGGERAIAPGAEHHLYLAFPFDSERRWNRGERAGALELVLALDGAALRPWRLALVHRQLGYHRSTRVDPRAGRAPRSAR